MTKNITQIGREEFPYWEDGSEIRLYNQLRLVDYPIIYMVLAPSQMVIRISDHQQYHIISTAALSGPEKTHQTFQVPKMEVLTYISCM